MDLCRPPAPWKKSTHSERTGMRRSHPRDLGYPRGQRPGAEAHRSRLTDHARDAGPLRDPRSLRDPAGSMDGTSPSGCRGLARTQDGPSITADTALCTPLLPPVLPAWSAGRGPRAGLLPFSAARPALPTSALEWPVPLPAAASPLSCSFHEVPSPLGPALTRGSRPSPPAAARWCQGQAAWTILSHQGPCAPLRWPGPNPAVPGRSPRLSPQPETPRGIQTALYTVNTFGEWRWLFLNRGLNFRSEMGTEMSQHPMF